MEDNKEEVKEPTYEQLKEAVTQLQQDNGVLYAKLQQLGTTTIFKRLDYLFKVIENETSFEKNFVDKCVNEVVEIMTPAKEEPQTEE
nr:MAG TPA: hypothetical protein [Crassvirales sp.]